MASDLFNFSFPSGHTTAAFVVAGVYALVLQRDRLTALLFSLALLAVFSRIAVGAHWPMDVFAGAGSGVVFGVGGLEIGGTLAWEPFTVAGNKHWRCSSCCWRFAVLVEYRLPASLLVTDELLPA